jgi:hypothetical protein
LPPDLDRLSAFVLRLAEQAGGVVVQDGPQFRLAEPKLPDGLDGSDRIIQTVGTRKTGSRPQRLA